MVQQSTTSTIEPAEQAPEQQVKKRKKVRAAHIIALILAVAGVGTLLYPTWLTHRLVAAMDVEVTNWQERTAEHGSSELDGLIAAMHEHNLQLAQSAQSGLKDPFSYEQPGFDLSAYGIAEDVVGRLKVSRLGLDAPIVLGGSADNLARGIALLGQTSLPVGGENTNVVLAGHRTPGMLWDVEDLQIGDTIEVSNVRDTLVYRIIETKVIVPSAIEEVLIQPEKDLITILTCHPLRKNYQRYLVRAERVLEQE